MKLNKNKIFIIIAIVVILIVSVVALTKRSSKTETNQPDNKQTYTSSKAIELSPEQRPYISLIPRADGHELKLKIENIPSIVNQIEYELIYTAKDKTSNLEMEKGVGDTIKDISKNIERDLLLGTSSCTNGCKYAYDEGVTGGTLSLTFNTNEGQAMYETPFVLKTSADIKTEKGLIIPSENLTITATTSTKNDYFVAIKNYKNFYSVFSSGNGTGKVSSIAPTNVTKENLNTLVGDYIIP